MSLLWSMYYKYLLPSDPDHPIEKEHEKQLSEAIKHSNYNNTYKIVRDELLNTLPHVLDEASQSHVPLLHR